eukprot:6212998-Pleurochrysis_carterae.AAC.1
MERREAGTSGERDDHGHGGQRVRKGRLERRGRLAPCLGGRWAGGRRWARGAARAHFSPKVLLQSTVTTITTTTTVTAAGAAAAAAAFTTTAAAAAAARLFPRHHAERAHQLEQLGRLARRRRRRGHARKPGEPAFAARVSGWVRACVRRYMGSACVNVCVCLGSQLRACKCACSHAKALHVRAHTSCKHVSASCDGQADKQAGRKAQRQEKWRVEQALKRERRSK